eukprot:scaffold23161_cov55-Attheya_sp.AAC.6
MATATSRALPYDAAFPNRGAVILAIVWCLLVFPTHHVSAFSQVPGSSTESAKSIQASEQFKQLRIAFVTGNDMKVRTAVSEKCNTCGTSSTVSRECDHGATRGPDPKTSLIDLRALKVDLPEIQEVDTEAIAKNKAILAAQLAGGPCVVEDTSLEFTSLGGMPGPYIKWFQQTLGSEGLYKTLYAFEDKSATAVCTLAFCPAPHADPVLFTGITKGTIVAPVEGRVPDGETEPFSCMDTEKKNSLSHRGKAVRQWAEWLGQNQMELWERQEGRPAVGHKNLTFKPGFSEE